MAILPSITARPIASAGRFCPLGPLGTFNDLLLFGAVCAYAVAPVEITGGFQRHRDTISLLVANIHRLSNARIADGRGSAFRNIVVHFLREMHIASMLCAKHIGSRARMR